MGFREDIIEEQVRAQIADDLEMAIKNAEYNNQPTSSLKALYDKYKSAFNSDGNMRHFED